MAGTPEQVPVAGGKKGLNWLGLKQWKGEGIKVECTVGGEAGAGGIQSNRDFIARGWNKISKTGNLLEDFKQADDIIYQSTWAHGLGFKVDTLTIEWKEELLNFLFVQ